MQMLSLSRAPFIKFLGDIRASFWFLPVVLLCVALLVASLLLWIDSRPDLHPGILPDAFDRMDPDGVRDLLSVIASSIIGVAGVMFSLTLVAVSFASGQFGPRLMGNFMRDRGTQLSLGVLIATFVFCLVVLGAVRSPGVAGNGAFVPVHAVAMVFVLVFLSIGVIIYFIHHVPEMIDVSNIAASLGRRLEAAVIREIEQELPSVALGDDRVPVEQAATINLGKAGYIQSLDLEQLQNLAERTPLVPRILANPGDYVSRIQPVLEVRGPVPIDEETRAALAACFALGEKSTAQQNPVFLVEQLVEVAVRALSPGINDPQTAIDCMNRLRAALELGLSHRSGLPSAERDTMGMKRLSFQSLLENSFGAVLPYAARDPIARPHLERCLSRLVALAPGMDERAALAALSSRLEQQDWPKGTGGARP